MSETETMTAARAAAQWWAKQIGVPVHKVVGDDPADPDRAVGDFIFVAMQIVAARHPVSESQGERFAAALEERIDGMLAGGGTWISIGVDYGPDRQLAEAADAAGVDCSRFPFKTHMAITPNYVTASLGYGAQARLIWQSPTWERPECRSIRHDPTTDRFLIELCGRPRFHDGDHGDYIPDPERCEACSLSQAEHWNDHSIKHTFKRPGEPEW
jgi:hypothetical protein